MAERSPGLWDDAAPDAGHDAAEDAVDGDAADESANDAGQDAALGIAARHALHDEELIAAFAGGDLEAGPEADRAHALVARCVACRDLHRDISSIHVAIRAAGTAAEVGARRTAPRDFRLTLEVATSLRPGARLRPGAAPRGAGSFLDRLAGAISTFGRPLGASLATLGIVGLLVGSVGLGPGSLGSSAGAHPVPGATIDIDVVTGPVIGGPSESSRSSETQALASEDGAEINPQPGPIDTGGDAGSAATWIVVGSAGVLALGVVLMVVATRDRRPRQSAGG